MRRPSLCVLFSVIFALLDVFSGRSHAQASSTNMLADWFRFTSEPSTPRLMASPTEVQRAVNALTSGDATHRARLDASITRAISDMNTLQSRYQSASPGFGFDARSWMTEASILYRIAQGVRTATGSPSETTLNTLRDEIVQTEMDLVGALQRVGSTTVNLHVGQASNIQGLAVICDWLYDHFTPAQRQSICQAILNYGAIAAYNARLAPGNHSDRKWWAKTSSVNNWSTIIIGGAGVMGSLAIRQADYDGSFACWTGGSNNTKVTRPFREHFDAFLPEAVSLLSGSMSAIPLMGGMWDEGPGYSHDFAYPLYGTAASLEVAVKNPLAAPPSFLADHFTVTRSSSASFVNMGIHFSGPHRQEYTHNDGNWSYTPNALCYRIADYARQHDANGIWRSAAWRAYDRTSSSTWSGLHLLWYSLFDWTQPTATTLGMSGFDPATTPLSHYFHGSKILYNVSNQLPGSNEHVAIWRQSWTDTNSVGLFFKGGDKRADHHEHLDTGDFLYDALGVRWNADLGPPVGYPAYKPPSPYTGSTSYQTYPKRAMGQNSIVVNAGRNDYLARAVPKVWLDVVNPDQAMNDDLSEHWAPLQDIQTSPGAPVWSASINLSSAYARHGIRTAAQGAPADPLRTFTWDRATGDLDIRDALHFKQIDNEMFWYWQLPGTGHKPIHLSQDRVVLQAMRGTTPVYLNIRLVNTNAATNGGFKYSRIDENLPPNQPADTILWGYDNSAGHRSNNRKLTLRLTTTGTSIDTTIRVEPLPDLTGISETSALIRLGLLDSLASTPSNWPFNNTLANAHGGASVATTAGVPAFQSGAPEGNASLLFDGVDDELRTNIPLEPGDKMTLAAWVKTAAGRGDIQTIAANSASGARPGFKLYINNFNTSDGALVFETSNGVSMLKASTATAAVASDTWTHVAAVVDRSAGHIRLFINGSLATTQPVCLTDFNSNGTLYLGRMAPGGTPFHFAGGIDDVRFLPRAMSASEIRALAATKAAARWTFQNDLSEVSGNHTAATPVNGPALSATEIRGGSQSLYIDGNDDAVELGAINLGTAFTVSQWVRIDTDRTGMQTLLFSRPAGATSGTAIHLYANSWSNPATADRKLYLYTGNGTQSASISSAANTVPFGEWIYVTAAINRAASSAKLYVNGSEVASGTIRNDFSITSPLFIGSMGGGKYTQNLKGHFDEVRIDPRVLTPDEIAGLAERRGTAPAISSVSVLPNAPLFGEAITLTTHATDADVEDNLRFSFHWGDGTAATPWNSGAASPSKTYAGGPSYTATARVDDGTFLTETNVPVTITLPPNEPPTIAAPVSLAATAGQTMPPMAFTVGDSFTPAESLMVTASSGNPSLLPVSALVLGGAGTSRTLTVNSPPWAAGPILVTLTVSDGQLTDEAVVTISFSNNGWSSNWTAASDTDPLPWSGGSNWSDARAPVPGPAAVVRFFDGEDLPAASLLSNQNTADPFVMSEWILGGTGPASEGGSIAITGNPVRMVSPDGTAPASIRLDATAGSGFSYIVSVPVELATNTTFSGDGDADFLFSGHLSGAGALTKTGNSTLTLGGSTPHSLGGIWTLSGGTLAFDPGLDQRIPASSAIRFTGGASWNLGGNAQTITTMTMGAANFTADVSNGSLSVQGSSNDLNLVPATTVNGQTTTFDMSGLAAFTCNVPAKNVRISGGGTYNNTLDWSLAAGTNTITANYLDLAIGGTTGNYPFNKGIMRLGRNNTLNIGNGTGNAIRISGYRSSGNVITFQDNPATLKVRASNGTGRAGDIIVAQGSSGTGSGQPITGTFDLGIVDALVGNIVLADTVQTGTGVAVTGTMTMAGGTLDATSLTLGRVNTTGIPTNINTLNGSFTQNGGSAIIGTLTMGNVIAGAQTTGNQPLLTPTYSLAEGAVLKAAVINANPAGGVFRNTSSRSLRINGGTLGNIAGGNLTISGADLTPAGLVNIVFEGSNNTFEATSGQTIEILSTAPISGSGNLVKTGLGTLSLKGGNTYSGDTIINAGTLEITTDDSLADAYAVRLSSGTTLHLTFIGEDTVGRLFINGIEQASGTWGSLASSATHKSALITGTGILAVANGSLVTNNYATWASLNSVSGGPNGDSDNDGIRNLVEYALADGTRGSLTGNTLTFTKRGAPWGGDLTYDIETSAALASWTTLAKPPVVETADSISCVLPPGTGKIFARLKVTQP